MISRPLCRYPTSRARLTGSVERAASNSQRVRLASPLHARQPCERSAELRIGLPVHYSTNHSIVIAQEHIVVSDFVIVLIGVPASLVWVRAAYRARASSVYHRSRPRHL